MTGSSEVGYVRSLNPAHICQPLSPALLLTPLPLRPTAGMTLHLHATWTYWFHHVVVYF